MVTAAACGERVKIMKENSIDTAAFFNISYGLFLLTAKEGERDNGCIINTASQLSDHPKLLSVSVNKESLTRDMIVNTGMFNVSILTEETPFQVFRDFGFKSGRKGDKFQGAEVRRSENGLLYLSAYSNAFLSARVIARTDYGTHTLFVAEVTEAEVLSKKPSVTYAYYFEHIKPKSKTRDKKGFVCKVCGYIYEGETLPPDYICPICKHGADVFEPIGSKKEDKTMIYVCQVCGYEYDEAKGEPDMGIAPGTKWEDVPEDFACPICGAAKDMFEQK